MGTTHFDEVEANSFVGPVTGDITGDITGDVTGNVTGDLTGNVDASATGKSIKVQTPTAAGTAGDFSADKYITIKGADGNTYYVPCAAAAW